MRGASRHSRESGNPEGGLRPICQNQVWRDLRDFDSPFATVIPQRPPRHSREGGNPEGICKNQDLRDWRDLQDFDSPGLRFSP